MSLLTLTQTSLTQGGLTPTNLTSALTSLGANTGVLFVNNGRVALFVSVGTTATTATSDIGLTIQGQSVSGQSSGALPTSAISILGPWPSQFNKTDGTNDVQIDFSSSTGITLALVYMPGVN
jgi:hypothetical protein